MATPCSLVLFDESASHSLVNQPLLPHIDRLQYLTVGRRVLTRTHNFRVSGMCTFSNEFYFHVNTFTQ